MPLLLGFLPFLLLRRQHLLLPPSLPRQVSSEKAVVQRVRRSSPARPRGILARREDDGSSLAPFPTLGGRILCSVDPSSPSSSRLEQSSSSPSPRLFFLFSAAGAPPSTPRMSRQKNQSIIDGGETHDQYVQEWNERKTRKDGQRKVLDSDDYEDHLRWYDDGIKHRLCLKTQWTTRDAGELYDDGSKNEAYHDNIRELQSGFREYGPLMNIIVIFGAQQKHFEGSDVLSSIPQTRDGEKKPRETVKKFVNKCRKLVCLLGCASSADAYAPADPMHSLASSSHVTSSSRVVGEDEEEYDEEDGEDEDDDKEQVEEEHE
ncbi:Strictosidine synthase 1 [Hordeum vulgare]|nr:Strictosidine synthase 1 [Hordeum vulgare]